LLKRVLVEQIQPIFEDGTYFAKDFHVSGFRKGLFLKTGQISISCCITDTFFF